MLVGVHEFTQQPEGLRRFTVFNDQGRWILETTVACEACPENIIERLTLYFEMFGRTLAGTAPHTTIKLLA